jgi:hypothetical protein
MCNIWTNEHVFIWWGSSTSTDARPLAKLVCRCGAYHYDGTPANLTVSDSKNYDWFKELRITRKKVTD